MPSRSRLIPGLAALSFLLFALAPAQAEADRSPRRLIDALGLEVRKILEDPKSIRTPEEAERAVAEQITALISRDEADLSLSQPDFRGRTPLMAAASAGYPQVVQALLSAPGVRLTVNVADAAGETAWMQAQFAPSVTLVACQPGMLTLQGAVLLPPYLRRMEHLLKNGGAALATVIEALEAAGAQPRPKEAGRAWLARCPNAAPALRQAIGGAPLLPMLVGESLTRLNEFNKLARDKPRDLPAKPPPGMKFIQLRPDGPAVPDLDDPLLPDGMRCDMPKLSIPWLDWEGKIAFRVVAETRAGTVESADIEVLSEEKTGRAADALKTSIVMALAASRCEGDGVFQKHITLVAVRR